MSLAAHTAVAASIERAASPSVGDLSISNDIISLSDHDSEESFSLVPMAFGTQLGPITNPTEEWDTIFTDLQRDSLYFGDYLAPFRQLLRDMKDNTPQE